MKRWYVIQIYAGYENAIKTDLLKRIEQSLLQDKFGDVLVPAAKTKQFFDADNASKDQHLFPGYMLVEMELAPETIKLVADTPKVTRFLGGKNPVPLSTKEVSRVLGQVSGEVVVAGQQHQFEVGKEVEIKDGPFAGFMGIIDSIDDESEKLTVMVSIFGRMTPVELAFEQVKQ